MQDFIIKAGAKSRFERLNANQALSHPFITRAEEDCQQEVVKHFERLKEAQEDILANTQHLKSIFQILMYAYFEQGP